MENNVLHSSYISRTRLQGYLLQVKHIPASLIFVISWIYIFRLKNFVLYQIYIYMWTFSSKIGKKLKYIFSQTWRTKWWNKNIYFLPWQRRSARSTEMKYAFFVMITNVMKVLPTTKNNFFLDYTVVNVALKKCIFIIINSLYT